jgi:hypothetical protein
MTRRPGTGSLALKTGRETPVMGKVQFELGDELVDLVLNGDGVWECKYPSVAVMLNSAFGRRRYSLKDVRVLREVLDKVARAVFGEVVQAEPALALAN